jgi:hypothetical protein
VTSPTDDDPVLAQRARAARWAVLGKRVGYSALVVACVGFVVGVLSDLPGWTVGVVVGGLAVATATLVPAIILGYAVAKAAREDPGPQPARPGSTRA